jgi:two-component system sensor histidine kinase TtrS
MAVLALGCRAGAATTVGVLAPEGFEEAQRVWQEMADQLAARLPQAQLQLRFFDLNGLRDAVAAGQVQFFIANSGFYVEMEAAYGATRIATLESPRAAAPGQAIASAIVVRRDRADLRRLSDLAGQRVLAVSETAFGGYQVAWRELARAGVDPQRDLASLRYVGYPLQDIARAVARGEADAGIVRACLLEDMAARGEAVAGELRVLEPQPAGAYPCQRSTRLYPDWPFAALRGTPHALAKQVAGVLLAMPATTDGYAWTVPTDYQPVHELFRELRTGPYAYLREHSPEAFLRRNWFFVVLAALLLAGWAVHTIRVDVLVGRRTRELRAAMEERERLAQAAHAQEQKLEHLARLGTLGEMSSMIAHELNQPLAAIANFARGLTRRVEAGRLEAAPLAEAGREIAGQAERAADVLQRIRGFARKRDARWAPMDLRAVIDSALCLYAGMLQHAPPVACDGAAAMPTFGDALQIEQVLLNLLKNAVDAVQALDPGSRRIDLRCRRLDGAWEIRVSDNGSGIGEGAMARLFEPFFTTKPDGVGLGLAICKTIVEAHGGRLFAQAHDGGPGLTVGFTLPVADDGKDQA